jgi:hypothetical protein
LVRSIEPIRQIIQTSLARFDTFKNIAGLVFAFEVGKEAFDNAVLIEIAGARKENWEWRIENGE